MISVTSSFSKVFEFLLECLVSLAKAVLFVAALPFLPIYYAAKLVSSNKIATGVFLIGCLLFFVYLIPTDILLYLAGFFGCALLVYLFCKVLDVNNVIAALVNFGVLPILNFGLILGSMVAFLAELLLRHVAKPNSVASVILIFLVSLVMIPIYPVVFFYQCARDRV